VASRAWSIALGAFLIVLAAGFGAAAVIHTRRGDSEVLLAGGLAVLLLVVGVAQVAVRRLPLPPDGDEPSADGDTSSRTIGLGARGVLASGGAALTQGGLWPVGIALGVTLMVLGIAEGRDWRRASRLLVTSGAVAQGWEAAGTIFLGFAIVIGGVLFASGAVT
jgi:hypothetical protein